MNHLLAISVGPVQEFIAAARRTRDLWFGSSLLSEVSGAVAKEVESRGGALIFPASSTAENVANVILAEMRAGDPREVAAAAKSAAQDHWEKCAAEARKEASNAIRADIWDDQVHDVIEFHAAWVPHTAPENYQNDRARVMRLLAGRKNCRDFLPARGRAGIPKSSLDGQRESVLKSPSEWPERFRPRLRIREGEQLDVVGLVKRIAGETRSYPSVARVAADPWVRGNQTRLTGLISACQQLGNQVIRQLAREHEQFAAFPFEGTAVFTSRHHELKEETEAEPDALRKLQNELGLLPGPEPYLAVLVADGDKMGETIAKLTSADGHREFSDALVKFATRAREIVNNQNGVLVYAGGDDVLAFVPVDRCLDCARKLHDGFGESLRNYSGSSLSVGVAIGHFMENLEDLLEYGRAAEKAAKKPDRDGLAVHLHKRGGAPIAVRARWTENPDARITRYAQLICAEAIPGKLPYDLRNLARLYEGWPADTVASAIRQDVIRVISDKQPRSGRQYMPEITNELKLRVKDAPSLHQFAEELLIARQIATALRQAGASPSPAQEATT